MTSKKEVQRLSAAIAITLLSGCMVWDVNQDPAGMGYRRDANRILIALQNYRRDRGTFPDTLAMVTPQYLPALPDIPNIRYSPADGSLRYNYIPSWPQLRPVHCASEGNTTVWRCSEHLTDTPL